MRLLVIILLACAQAFSAPARSDGGQSKSPRHYVQQAMKAYGNKDYTSYLENLKMAVSLSPTHPVYLYNLAGAYALNGNKGDALASLSRVAEMGLICPAAKDKDFDSIKDSPEFKAILKMLEVNTSPIHRSAEAFTVAEKGLIVEGIAYDGAADTFYLSSVYRRKIVSFNGRGEVKEFAGESDGLWSVMGMKVDARRRHLWVATTAHPQMVNYREEEKGSSAILKFDLATGKLVKKYLLANNPKPHWLGDLVVSSAGDVYASDSLSAAIYTIRRAKDELELLVEGEPFSSPQGLDFTADESRILMADYSKGVFVIDPRTKKITALAAPPNVTLIGIDGLYRHKNTLIAVQNGVNPHRVIRLHLDRQGERVERFETLEANNPLFDEPTLGVVVKDTFYYVADSQWGAIDKSGKLAPAEKLRETVILKVKL